MRQEILHLQSTVERHLSTVIQKQKNAEKLSLAAMEYSLLSGGKRLRPLLTYHIATSLDKNAEAGALDIAAAIECIHTYSLIHDDLPCMDNDDFRRGKPSLHKAFGEDIALLAGDALLTLAFELISYAPQVSDAKKVAMIQQLTTAIGPSGMIGGQAIDMRLEKHTISQETASLLYYKKTACLFQAAITLGAILGNATSAVCNQLKEFGEYFGILFQIADDIEDVLEGKSEPIIETLGKELLFQWYDELSQKATLIIKDLAVSFPLLKELLEKLNRKVNDQRTPAVR